MLCQQLSSERLTTIAVSGNKALHISQAVRQHRHTLFALKQIAQMRRQMQRLTHARLTDRIRELDRMSGAQRDHRHRQRAAALAGRTHAKIW